MKQNRKRLAQYYWQGWNQAGQLVRGKIIAIDEQEVRYTLQQRRVQIQQINRRTLSPLQRLQHRTNRGDITHVTRQLATMLSSDISLVQALALVARGQAKAEMRSVLHQLIEAVQSGFPLSEALARSSYPYTPLYRHLIASGEQSGNLAQMVDRLASYLENEAKLRRKIKGAMIYPCAIVFVALLVSLLLMIFVIPEFEELFASFDAQLPWFTTFVLSLSHALQQHWFKLLLFIVAASLCVQQLRRLSTPFRLLLSQLSLSVPIVGKLIRHTSLSRFSQTLATNIYAGVPLLDGLKDATNTTNHAYYQQVLKQVYYDIQAGSPLYLAFQNTQAFPEFVVQMITIGEQSGKLDEMLTRVTHHYDQEVEMHIANLGNSLEPLILILLGGMVGGLVVAMYLPIFNLMDVMG